MPTQPRGDVLTLWVVVKEKTGTCTAEEVTISLVTKSMTSNTRIIAEQADPNTKLILNLNGKAVLIGEEGVAIENEKWAAPKKIKPNRYKIILSFAVWYSFHFFFSFSSYIFINISKEKKEREIMR